MSRTKAFSFRLRLFCQLLGVLGAVFLLVLVAAGGIHIAPAQAETAPVAQQETPLVVVFDTSGSMADDDPNGQNKLATAKKLMTTLVRERGTGVALGLWTYPGGQEIDGCKVGSWVPQLRPVDHPDPTNVDAQIRQLSADGGTPTGPALQAVVKELKAQGYTAARLVLVTDGESNCGIDPCEVAKQIVADGFNLEVHAVAFDQKGQSNDEVQCIAKATGGTFTTADNSEELFAALEKFERKQLLLQVSAATVVQAGDMFAVTATITNPNDQPVSGATLVLSTDTESKVKYYSPVRHALPAIPAGGSIARTWYLVTTAESTAEQVHWKVFAGVASEGATTTSGITKLLHQPPTRTDAGPVIAPHNGTVVVLGDSYSSGEGAGNYLENKPVACHRSLKSYGGVLGGDQTTIIACSGATTANVWGTAQSDQQPKQLDSLSAELFKDDPAVVPDVVFMTIGGNDINFGQIVQNCVLNSDCTTNEQAFIDNIDAFGNSSEDKLADLYIRISEMVNTEDIIKARGGLPVPVVISPYPDPLWEPSKGTCSAVFSQKELRMAKKILGKLNSTISGNVEKVRASGYPVFYAEPVVEMALGHSSCTTDSYFVSVDPANIAAHAFNTQELFHPNQQGYEAWARTLVTWSQSGDVVNQELTFPKRKFSKEVKQAFLQVVKFLTKNLVPRAVDLAAAQLQPVTGGIIHRESEEISALPGSKIRLGFGGLQPGSAVQVIAKSNPVQVGTLVVDQNGNVSGEVELPQLPNGLHTLQLTGWDKDGQLLALQVPLRVGLGLPVFVVIILVICLISGLLGLILLLRRKKLKQQLAQLSA